MRHLLAEVLLSPDKHEKLTAEGSAPFLTGEIAIYFLHWYSRDNLNMFTVLRNILLK
jgi:hypothetical protein